MHVHLEKINKIANELIDKNLTLDITEQKIIELIHEDEIFVITMTSACPTSFLTCC